MPAIHPTRLNRLDSRSPPLPQDMMSEVCKQAQVVKGKLTQLQRMNAEAAQMPGQVSTQGAQHSSAALVPHHTSCVKTPPMGMVPF